MSEGKSDTTVPGLAGPLCPFCSAIWSEDNVIVWDVDSADQCEDGRFERPTYSISIKCHACCGEMYRKEGAHARYYEDMP